MNKTAILAEIGLAHEGSLNLAHAFVDAIAEAGADAVKAQCHLPEESSLLEQWRTPWSRYGESRQDYWRRTAFTKDQWRGLKEHAQKRGLQFIPSVFCVEAVDLLDGIADAWKVPSGQVCNGYLIKRLAKTKQRVYLSNGLWFPRSDHALELIGHNDFVYLHCVTEYPTPHTKACWPLAFGPCIGLSDHSGTIWPGLLAAAQGAAAVEVHVTFDRAMGGPDATSSITFAELRQLCDGVKAFAALNASVGQPRPRPANAHLYEPSWFPKQQKMIKTSGQAGRPPEEWWTHNASR